MSGKQEGELIVFTLVDKFNSSKDDCIYHIANALNACAIALGGIAVVLIWMLVSF